jgi:hypothetical protein
MKTRLLILALLLVTPGCPKQEAQPTKEEPKAEPKTTEVKKEEPKKEEPKKEEPKKEEAKGWTAYPGPDVPVSLAAGQKHWAAIPIAMDWQSLKITQLDYKGVEGKNAAFTFIGRELHVPSAWVRAAEPAKVKAGSPVLLNIYVTSNYGRVTEVKGDKVVVAHPWALKVESAEVSAQDVLLLSGELEFGAPVAYKQGADWYSATLLHKGADKSWVMGFAGKPLQVPTADVKAVPVGKVHKVGAAVWARFGSGKFMEAKVVGVLDKGLRYQTKWTKFPAGDKPDEMVYAHVTTDL